jgi:GMP synthase PP-ATPase subunit
MPITDSRKTQLDPIDIIKTAVKETRSRRTDDEAIVALSAEMNSPTAIAMREGNTIYIIHYVPEKRDHGMFRVLNADTAPNYLRNTQEFLRAAGMSGFRVLVVQFETAEPLTLFKKIMRNPPFPGMGYTIQKSKKGQYTATINMGDTSKGAK